MALDYQLLIDIADREITNNPRRVIVVFLVVTGVFTLGFGAIESETGQNQFVEDLPSWDTLQDVQDDFDPAFGRPQGSDTTRLLQESQNVLSKSAMLRLLETQQTVADKDEFRVTSTSSHAGAVAQTLDPKAETLEEQIDALERATPLEVKRAVRETNQQDPTFTDQLSSDFNPSEPHASAARATISHGSSEITDREDRVTATVEALGNDVRVFGSLPNTIFDSLRIVLPAALVLIVLFLAIAYRDPIDLVLGVGSILMVLIWTFGFMGLAGIKFNPLLVSVPPLLIAVGIDFSIHAINRYREERVTGQDVFDSMKRMTDQLLVAFFIVMGTTVIGFLANLTSALDPIKDFGLAAAVGIVFTFLIFGIFLPAAKLYLDLVRDRYPIPDFSSSPFGSEESRFGRLLSGGVVVARRAPVVFLVLVVLLTVSAGWYATGVDTEFSPEDFQPEAETPEALLYLPEPIRPPEGYQYVKNVNFEEEKFGSEGDLLMYVEAPMTEDHALTSLDRAMDDPPETFETRNRRAVAGSVLQILDTQSEQNPELRRVIDRNDRNDDGIPDRNLEAVYETLDEDQLSNFVGEDRRSTLVVYTINDSARLSEIIVDARTVAEGHRGDASPTGNAVIFQEASNLILQTALQSLILALIGTVLFLILSYWVLEGRPSLGVVNTIPILFAVALIVASMRFFNVDFNSVNVTILAMTIGLGVDYSVHIVHRFIDERRERPLTPALRNTVVGTGGALTGTLLTTVAGLGVLLLALNPVLGVFGLLTGLSVTYAYIASVFVLPSVLVLWDRYFYEDDLAPDVD